MNSKELFLKFKEELITYYIFDMVDYDDVLPTFDLIERDLDLLEKLRKSNKL